MSSILAAAAGEPPGAGGAPIDQIVIATVFAMLGGLALVALLFGYRSGRVPILGWASSLSERIAGVPGWAALPAGVATAGLLSAYFGVTWDVSLHIEDGRDEGPLANPAHYFILLGLGLILAAGVLAVALPGRERPGPWAIRITRDMHAPVGGVLFLVCAAFAGAGFPLDDVWHRLFGQDVTLWGPTHLMMISGAILTIVGIMVLLEEGRRARHGVTAVDAVGDAPGSLLMRFARCMAPAALLIATSVYLFEFDWGVPQYRAVWQPLLLFLGAGIGLVCARVWAGPGGALIAAGLYIVTRQPVDLIVGEVFGQQQPAMHLFLAEALCVEVAALLFSPRTRPFAFALVAGGLMGTAGFAAEYAWTHVVYPLPWQPALLDEGIPTALVAATAGSLLGLLLALGMRGALPATRVARPLSLACLVAVLGLGANALWTTVPDGVTATVTYEQVQGGDEREAYATVHVDPPSAARDAEWVSTIAWQGEGIISLPMKEIGDGVFRSASPVPLHGDWKTALRIHKGHAMSTTPLYLPEDSAIPAPEVSVADGQTAPLIAERQVLQREVKDDVPKWIWTPIVALVLAAVLGFVTLLAVGVARIGRDPRPPRAPTRQPQVSGGALAGTA